MIIGGLLAGGSGTRMETANIPKQFLEVAGIPIFIRGLNIFLSVPEIEKIVVSINNAWESRYYELIELYKIPADKIILVPGGETRFISLINITRKAFELSNESVLVTHDCARIFCSKEIVYNNIAALNHYRIATTSIPVIDTILFSENGASSKKVLDRDRLWADQGPQSFFTKEFLELLNQLPLSEYQHYIEAGKLYLENNIEVGIIKGERTNFKITNDIDLAYAAFLIERGIVK